MPAGQRQSGESPVMQQPYMVVEQFFDGADEMRAAFEAHFAEPHRHTPQHQVWNYWYIPELYTYLRTNPAKIMPESLVTRFLQRLNNWAASTLGLNTPFHPWISLYVSGCGQGLHNDSLNGQMGYVYSLTKWEGRNFQGGETILFRSENYWETDRIKTAGAGASFYNKVPSRFNQLLVFDDRVIHGVAPIMGTMDPVAGRVVLHGHLKAESAILTGALPVGVVRAAAASVQDRLRALLQEHAQLFHGFMTLRLHIGPEGRVAFVQPLCDRILPLSHDTGKLEAFKTEISQLVASVPFPAAHGPSELTLPVIVGG
jgi:hypothetical protein